MHSSKLIDTEEYQSFRSSVALRKIAVDADLTKVVYQKDFLQIYSPPFVTACEWSHDMEICEQTN